MAEVDYMRHKYELKILDINNKMIHFYKILNKRELNKKENKRYFNLQKKKELYVAVLRLIEESNINEGYNNDRKKDLDKTHESITHKIRREND